MPEPEQSVPRCPRCGHNFYRDAPVRDGLCSWCVDEINSDQSEKVLVIVDAPFEDSPY